MMVKNIIIYPVKSLGGSSKHLWEATSIGFKHDRQWLLVDENNNFITQREIPRLSLFSCDIVGDNVEVSFQNQKISWPIDQRGKNKQTVKIWDDQAIVVDVDLRLDAFFSDILETKVFLLKQDSSVSRQHFVTTKNKNINVNLADGYPYLVLGTSSMNLINSKLEKPIDFNRFRPNIVIETHEAHEEDFYKSAKIGDTLFENVKPCARCQIINVDPYQGIFLKEPIKTLSKYRKFDHKIYFGTNMMCTKSGIISVGDPVTLL
ncbi:MAG: MOSC domain-containing protein [Saprospiraceae bacterium]|nr:MOSC domain-containing protein [Saprospiraceae bacterium]MBK7523900.1 MOSC domain-containing protein [Saprospiraceae bacterium]MBK8371949.1 MOSC domain-containing protein [Saprospiraceae bacterium]MBK8547219.1 MOSC domain-containing protein [Saprospiraceae bacterium]MBK8853157.1 MOSC domain-containing protein [Saprospiraceae bacterium]